MINADSFVTPGKSFPRRKQFYEAALRAVTSNCNSFSVVFKANLRADPTSFSLPPESVREYYHKVHRIIVTSTRNEGENPSSSSLAGEQRSRGEI